MTDDDEAHARREDPDTSHEAAESITPEALRKSQLAVYETLARFGPMTDFQLARRYPLTGYPRQTESGLRTRRNELCRQGRVQFTGKRVFLPTGRRAREWSIV